MEFWTKLRQTYNTWVGEGTSRNSKTGDKHMKKAKIEKKLPLKAAPLKAAKAPLKTAQAPKTAAMKAAPGKSSKKAEPKIKLAVEKLNKKSAKIELQSTALTVVVSEDEDEEMDMGSSSSNASSEAGLAAASASASADAAAGSLKNFRHHPDIENFYRFIYENDLRYEALEIIDVIVAQRATRKQVKVAKSKAH